MLQRDYFGQNFKDELEKGGISGTDSNETLTSLKVGGNRQTNNFQLFFLIAITKQKQ